MSTGNAATGAQTVVVHGLVDDRRCRVLVHVGDPAAHALGAVPDPSKMARVMALIDTGATSTTLSQEFADKIGLQGRTKAVVAGLGGTHPGEQAPTLVYIGATHGSFVAAIIPALVVGIDEQVLIGMDILGLGTFTVDGQGKTWMLSVDIPT